MARPLGISLDGLREFVASHGGDAAFTNLTTSDVQQAFVLSSTAATRTSYAAQLQAASNPHVSPANVFVGHAYAYHFLDTTLAGLEAWESTQPRGRYYYYVDLFCVNQHFQSGTVVTFESAIAEFGGAVRELEHYALVLEWDASRRGSFYLLTRAWCVFELATAAFLGKSVRIAMSSLQKTLMLADMECDIDAVLTRVFSVDVAQSRAREALDQASIHRLISEHGGHLTVNTFVIGSLKTFLLEEGRRSLASREGPSRDLFFTRFLDMLFAFGKLEEAQALVTEYFQQHPVTVHSLQDQHTATDTAADGAAGGGSAPGPSLPPPRGLSLAGLEAAVALLPGGRAGAAGRTTKQLKQDVKAATLGTEQGLVQMVQDAHSPHVGDASVFVSHSYDYEVLETFAAVAAWEARTRAAGHPGPFFYYCSYQRCRPVCASSICALRLLTTPPPPCPRAPLSS